MFYGFADAADVSICFWRLIDLRVFADSVEAGLAGDGNAAGDDGQPFNVYRVDDFPSQLVATDSTRFRRRADAGRLFPK